MKQTILFYLSFLIFSGCSKQERIQPTVSPITESVYASGIVKAEDQYKVYPDVSGILEKKLVDIGDTVEKNTPLFKIENQISELNKENARLNLELTEENREHIRNLQREADLARKQMEQDSLMYQRQQRLWREGVGAKVDLEQRRLAFQSSRIRYSNALTQLRQARSQFRLETEQAKNNLSISREEENNFIVHSQTGGKVFSIMVEEGEAVNPQTVLAIVGKSEGFLIEVQVDENDIVKVKNGQEIFVTMDSYKDTVFKAVVTKIHPFMNNNTGTFTVEGTFIKLPPELYPNLNLEANILIHKKEKALVIPRDYLIDEKYVLVDKDEKKEVQTGLKNYEYVEITGGLTKDQYIYKP